MEESRFANIEIDFDAPPAAPAREPYAACPTCGCAVDFDGGPVMNCEDCEEKAAMALPAPVQAPAAPTLEEAVRAAVTPVVAPTPPRADLSDAQRRAVRDAYDRANGTTTVLTAQARIAPPVAAQAPAPATVIADRSRVVAVAEHTETTGAVVFWNGTSGATLAAYDAACEAEGLDERRRASAPSKENAFRRAAKAEESRTLEVAATKGRASWVLVHRGMTDDGAVTLGEQVRVRLDLEVDAIEMHRRRNNVWELLPPNAGPRAQALVDRLARNYAEARTTFTAQDMTGWLVELVEALGGVPLRGHGGVYFIPAAGVETYQKAARIMRRISAGAAYEIPALRAGATVEAVTAALAAEVTARCADIEGELAAGEMGTRKAQNRLAELHCLLGKVGDYEVLFGLRLEAPRVRVDGVMKSLTQVTTRTSGLEVD